MEIINYSESFKAALLAQGKDSNVLILHKLDHPVRRLDGKKAFYELEYRWLSTECKDESDEAWCCVSGTESTYWQRKELPIELFKNGSKTLFDHFNLFG